MEQDTHRPTGLRERGDAAPAPSGRAPVVLLASTCAWPSTPKLALALADAGCETAALTPEVHPLHLTRSVSRRFRYQAPRPLASLANAIEQVRPDFIVPCDERVIAHLHRLHEHSRNAGLRELVERSIGHPGGYAAAASRQSLMTLAADLGVPTPETGLVSSRADLHAWGRGPGDRGSGDRGSGDQAHAFPWVLKVDGSWGGLGVRVVSSLEEAERAFVELSRRLRPIYAAWRLIRSRDPFWLAPWLHHPPGQITVQAYVEGRRANCAIMTWRGESLAGIGVEVLGGDGEVGPASIVQQARDGQMLEAGAKLARALGSSGLVGFDFIIEAAGGRAVLLEMNPRATPICHLRLGEGRDLVGALVAQLTGAPVPQRAPDTLCDVIALFPQAEQQYRGHPLLAVAYHDTPVREPDLVRALAARRPPRRGSEIAVPAPAPAE